MNIQPSVMVWTVICFLILMVILKNLLFTPLLKIMDSRREKIQAASKKKEDIEKCILEHKNQAEKEKALAEEKGVPYQALINSYLREHEENREEESLK